MNDTAHRFSTVGLALLLALGLGIIAPGIAPVGTAHADAGDASVPAAPYGVEPTRASEADADTEASERRAPSVPAAPYGVDANPYAATPENPFAPGPIESAHAERAAEPAANAALPTPPREMIETAAVTSVAPAPRRAAEPVASPAPTAPPAPSTSASAELESDDSPADSGMFDSEPLDMDALAERAAAQPVPASDDRGIAALDAVLSDETADPISGVTQDEPAPEATDDGGPSREQVQDAIAEVVPGIRACVDGQRGRVVQVRGVFASSGRVRATTVDAQTAHFTPAQRSCMARAARDARLPAFERETFEVTFPVRL